jgi:hypothetical protein
VEGEVRLSGERERAEFLDAYLEAIGPLLAKYGRKRGVRYRMALAVYPQPELEEDT